MGDMADHAFDQAMQYKAQGDPFNCEKSDTITLPCLSIQQPWAWAILNAGKDIENRNWQTNYLGLFLIHAGKKIDIDGIDYLNQDLLWSSKRTTNVLENGVDGITFPTGGIVGIAEITGCTRDSESDWFFGPVGWRLQNAIGLPFHPCQGKLKFFDAEYPKNDVIENYLKYKGW